MASLVGVLCGGWQVGGSVQSNGTPSAPGRCDSLDCDSLSALSVGVGDVEDDRDGLLYSVSSALERFVVTVVYIILQ